ncbi:anthranilate synthase component II [Pelistega sp. NLN82]|uniref:Anthranilate synthase component II n=1 Tax=Pelistega ratti TaxID=2652177 RepID=A0A6L9Y4P7_9BURK|nr:anthranilate synthase component II [Pelistega ratti]NEN75175.1 anthranilate synthase component II [Pelistega ratti]
MRLLIINNHDSFTYNLVDYIRRLNITFDVVTVEQLEIDQVEQYSHILISPGPDVPDAYPQLFALLERYYQHKSILGVCLGHQTLCQFFGATLYNLDKVRHGQSKQLNVIKTSLLFHHLPLSFQIGLYHSWVVSTDNFPDVLDITAVCEDKLIMAVQHKTLPLFGVQFHPESFISENGLALLSNWLKGEM